VANFSVSNFTSLAGFTSHGQRIWSVANSNIRTGDQNSVGELGTAGTLIYDTLPDLNGTVSATYELFDSTEAGKRNGLAVRYIDENNYIAFNIDTISPSYDPQGIFVSRATDANTCSNVQIPMYKADGVILPQTSPYYTSGMITPTGKIVVNIHDTNQYHISIYNDTGLFICSGDYIDTAATSGTNGYIGFSHCNNYNGGWLTDGGWDSLAWEAQAPTYTLPAISISADHVSITQGDSSTICWSVSDGGDVTTQATFEGTAVSLIDCSAVSPTSNKTYNVSAWNSIGGTSADILIQVAQHLPVINYLSATAIEISAGQSPILHWQTNYASSAFTDFNGWNLYGTSGVVTSSVTVTPPPTETTTYHVSAYGPGITIPDVSAITITVDQLPVINSFTPDSITCSGSPFTLSWSFGDWVTSAYMDNGVGRLDTSAIPTGSIVLSAETNTVYALSAYNNVNQFVTCAITQSMYIYPPTMFISALLDGVLIPDGGGIDVTDVGGSTITLDLSDSYDQDTQTITFIYYDNGDYITSGVSLSILDVNTTVGTHVYTVHGLDPCGNDVEVSTTVIGNSQILPIGIVTNSYETDTIYTNTIPFTIVLDSSDSYSPLSGSGVSITSRQWFTGTHLDQYIPGETNNTVSLTLPNYGTYLYCVRVFDSQGYVGRSNIVSITIAPGEDAEELDPIIKNIGPYCATIGGATNVTLDASDSIGYITSYTWDLTSIGAGIQSGPIVTGLTVPIGTNKITLTINGGGKYNYTSQELIAYEKPLVSTAIYVYDGTEYTANTITINCPDTTAHITLSADCTNLSDTYVDYTWSKSYKQYNGILHPPTIRWIVIGNSKVLGIDVAPTKFRNEYTDTSYRCAISRKELPSCSTTTSTVTPTLKLKSDELVINSFSVDPRSLDYDDSGVGSADPVTIRWNVSGSEHVYITIDGIPYEEAPVDFATAMILASQDITISAVSGNCSKTISIPVTVHDGLSACLLKEDYITLYAPEIVRYGADRLIDLVGFNNDVFENRDINSVIQLFQTYLNTMFDGDNGRSQYNIPITTSATSTSADYLASGFYQYEVVDE
jgi:hypothetical protein